MIEILGDEGLSTEDVDISIGEFYYKLRANFKYINSEIKVGLFKLDYGHLNNVDDHFFRLPSYYKFLYGLPRGIDTGIYVDNQILKSKVYIGMGAYLGKALRATDLKRRKSFGTPFSTHLRYKFRENSNIKLNYFIREYEDSPRLRGLSLSYVCSFDFRRWSLMLFSEIMSLNLNSQESNSSAKTILFAPKISYSKVYFQPALSAEKWSTNASSSVSSETFQSYRSGVHLTDNFTLEVEYLKIGDSDGSFPKEEQFITRCYLNWDF